MSLRSRIAVWNWRLILIQKKEFFSIGYQEGEKEGKEEERGEKEKKKRGEREKEEKEKGKGEKRRKKGGKKEKKRGLWLCSSGSDGVVLVGG